MFAGGTGTDTATVVIEWAISEILKRPETSDKATEELDRVIGRGHLPYIEAIVKEAMRMHPVVVPLLAPRLSREHTTVDGYDIPLGTQVLVNVWDTTSSCCRSGAGRRMCPGNSLGLKMVHLSLANLLAARVQMEATAGDDGGGAEYG
ncbi:hypothetical protein BHM03_00007191 [Ensete ventricosum]|nr:hypothetical protein BHM03_00007191 [Ensete ventricosum]